MRQLGILLAFLMLTADAQVVWVQNGPGPNTAGEVETADGEVAGAINAIAPHPADPRILYVGSVNGGMWRTTNATDAAPVWTELASADRTLSIGAVAFDPTDGTNQTLVAGAGRFSSFGRGGELIGVQRTIDGGTTWDEPDANGTLTGVNISGIAARGAIILVSANDADDPARAGIWRSTTTGQSWMQVSGASGSGLPRGASFDLAADPAVSTRFYTNAGGAGVYRSDNSGATWNKVSNGLMDALLPSALNVKIAAGMTNNVYAAIVGSTGRLVALLRSSNAGGSWTGLDLPATVEDGARVGIHPGRQGASNLSLLADRANPNVVYIGGDRQPYRSEFTTNREPFFPNSIGANHYSGRLFRVDASKLSGRQAVPLTHVNTPGNTAPHADSRAMQFAADGSLLESDDGGVYRRLSPATNGGDWSSVNGNLNVAEFHSVAWDSNAHVVIGGTQDIGTPEQIQRAGTRWRSVDVADGAGVTVAASVLPGQSLRYSSTQGLGRFQRRTMDQSNTQLDVQFPPFTPLGDAESLEPQFITPLALNKTDPLRLVIGAGNGIFESVDGGDTIMEIGRGIRVNFIDAHALAFGAADNPDIVYAGSADRVITRTAAGGPMEALQNYPGTGSGRLVAGIALDRQHASTAFVVDESRVFVTTTGGASWSDITGNLQSLAPGRLFTIALSTSNAAHTVVVGGAAGAFASRGPGFGAWTRFGTGLPRAAVYDLVYDATDEVLVAGLLGRGVWVANMKEPQ